jgi:hypothetical protein
VIRGKCFDRTKIMWLGDHWKRKGTDEFLNGVDVSLLSLPTS